MRICTLHAVYLAIGLAACSTEGPSESRLPGDYHPAAYQLVMYDVVASPPGTEIALSLQADGSFSGRLWFPAPWAPFWGDTSSYELLLSGTWETGDGQLPSLAGKSAIPTDRGPGLYLHPAQTSFMTNTFFRVRHDTLYGRIQTYDEPGPIYDIYLDIAMVQD